MEGHEIDLVPRSSRPRKVGVRIIILAHGLNVDSLGTGVVSSSTVIKVGLHPITILEQAISDQDPLYTAISIQYYTGSCHMVYSCCYLLDPFFCPSSCCSPISPVCP